MHDFVSYNHNILSAAKISISPISSSCFYGRGIFTTIAIRNAKPFLWEKHWRRLTENAKTIGLDIAEHTEQTVISSILELIQRQNISEARCRLTFFDESHGKLWSFSSEAKTSLLITTAERSSRKEIKLGVSPFRVNSYSALVNVKSCNYLENILASEEARSRGFDEAIRINERGEIASACMANIFWLKDSQLFTPSLKTGCLAGTTRELVLENFDVFEVECTLDAFTADEIFITSSGLGIASAISEEYSPNPIGSKTKNDLQSMIDLNVNLLT